MWIYMKRLLTLLLICAAIGCTSKHNLVIKLNGFENDTLILGTMPLSDYISGKDENIELDTLVAKNGVIKTNIATDDSPKYFQLIAHQYSMREGDHTLPSPAGIIYNFITTGDNIRMALTALDNNLEAKVNRGSQANKDIADVRNSYRKLAYEYFALITGQKGQELSAKERNIAFGESFEAMNRVIEEFVNNNPDKEASLFLLFSLQLSPNQVVKHLGALDSSLFTEEWNEVNTFYERAKTINDVREKARKMIDNKEMAFDFTQTDINGNEFTLSSLRGKWVVLDFWGSWCGPCMRGVPMMKKYYNRYRNKMEIVGIACSDKEAQWRKAVEKNEMTWTNIIHPDGAGPAKSIKMNYAISGFPTKIIITPEGRIHKVFIGESEDFYKEIDKIMR